MNLIVLCGQGYDGAGNMAAIITIQYPLALYLHCFFHQLNLAMVKSAEVTIIRNMVGTSKKLHDYHQAHTKLQQEI